MSLGNWLRKNKVADSRVDRQWEDCPRTDLNSIPKALQKGWTPDFDDRDKYYNRITPQDIPCHPVSFIKGNKTAWRCIKVSKPEHRGDCSIFTEYWCVVDHLDGKQIAQRIFDNFDQILETE
jgi:hypothetical protein